MAHSPHEHSPLDDITIVLGLGRAGGSVGGSSNGGHGDGEGVEMRKGRCRYESMGRRRRDFVIWRGEEMMMLLLGLS